MRLSQTQSPWMTKVYYLQESEVCIWWTF